MRQIHSKAGEGMKFQNFFPISEESLEIIAQNLDTPPWTAWGERKEFVLVELSTLRKRLTEEQVVIVPDRDSPLYNGTQSPARMMPHSYKTQLIWKLDLAIEGLKHRGAQDILEVCLQHPDSPRTDIEFWFDASFSSWVIDFPGLRPFLAGASPNEALLTLRVLIARGLAVPRFGTHTLSEDCRRLKLDYRDRAWWCTGSDRPGLETCADTAEEAFLRYDNYGAPAPERKG